MQPQQLNRHRVVLAFLRLQHSQKGDTVEDTRRKTLALMASRAHDRGTYVARQLPGWEKAWIEHRSIPEGKQGHARNMKSLLADEDMEVFTREWINENRGHITAQKLRKAVYDYLGSRTAADTVTHAIEQGEKEHQIGHDVQATGTLRTRTARTWLHRLGLRYNAMQKGVYKDGHEREDVVRYRQEVFLPRFFELLPKCVKFEEDGSQIYPKGTDHPFVLLTHDESWFNSNDTHAYTWVEKDQMPLRKKGRGKGLMVSEFLTPNCRLHAYDEDGQSIFATETLEAGQGTWWGSEQLLQQVKKAVQVFRKAHPNCIGIWLFDNAASHGAFSSDALLASSIALRPGGKQPRMRDGFYGNPRLAQKMCFPSDHESYPNAPKGAKVILEERNLWRSDLVLDCKSRRGATCNSNGTCCARSILANQEDFKSQKGLIEEYLAEEGQLTLFYPKFHCECNWIERFWGACKRYTREHCDFTVPGLRHNVSAALSNVPQQTVHRFFEKSLRIMTAYHDGVQFETEEYQNRVYRSHRRIEDPASW